jgi:ketosteroid isomerase-like protein
MDPRVVATNDNEVMVLYRQSGLSPAGDRYDGEVLGLYEFRQGKLTRAQMFYFDEVGAAEFLAKAKSEIRGSK